MIKSKILFFLANFFLRKTTENYPSQVISVLLIEKNMFTISRLPAQKVYACVCFTHM